MISTTQIFNWLTTGFEQCTGNLTEMFYYDKIDSVFFSVVISDHFILNENMEIATDVITDYTPAQLKSVVDWMKRISDNDPNILAIPRVTLEDRKVFMHQFIGQLTNEQLAAILREQIQNQDYKTTFDFCFEQETDAMTKQSWQEEKTKFLQQQVHAFLKGNNISIEKTTLWIADTAGTVTINLTGHDKTITLKPTLSKSWWKFW
jgi:hypothetical protein